MPPTKRSRYYVNVTQCDRISELPSSIIDTILMCLPTRDAARTSILSRKWRYNWSRIPQLVIDDELWNATMKKYVPPREKFLEILYQILSLHQGPIFKFILSVTGLRASPHIDNLIVLLSRSGIKEFTLKLSLGEYYMMPLSFFSCVELMHLNLRSCWINKPTTFKGFSHLISLKLSHVYMGTEFLQSLISSCPILEQLTLEYPDILNFLEINAPKLKLFVVNSPIKSIFFKNTPVLAMVSLELNEQVAYDKFPKKGQKGIVEHFRSLPSLENLHLDHYFVKVFTAGGISYMMTTALIHLKVLKLDYISLEALNELSFVMRLIRSSPNLQEIDISVNYDEILGGSSSSLNVQDNSEVTLKQLREVKLKYISGTRNQMELIKLLLEKSPVLGKMFIKPIPDDTCQKVMEIGILKQLTRFHRASPNAEIIYEDPVQMQAEEDTDTDTEEE
ncbi:hypothetical protein ACH5RR_036043 [Cinchona calisaya]|uniref:F-box domain-containing protein n=1 Tax=Cinchona calisaya TaxID=153742 RepID=A0ABD2Y5M6_9GENT